MTKKIEVWTSQNEVTQEQKIGILAVAETRGKELYSFEHSDQWLVAPDFFEVDPQLLRFSGDQYTPKGQVICNCGF